MAIQTGLSETICELGQKSFGKTETMRNLFSDEKLFGSGGIYNVRVERICAATRADADTKGAIRQNRKFPIKAMIGLAVGAGCISSSLFSIVARLITTAI